MKRLINSVIYTNITFIRLVQLMLIVLIFILCTYQVFAFGDKDEWCYKTKNESIFILPSGLEVDSKGNIYIGVHGKINVYNNSGEFIHAIVVSTTGTFQMKFDNDDNLNVALSREEIVLVYDTEGYILQKKEDKESKAFYEYEKSNRTQKDALGNEYKLSNFLGYTKVTKTSPEGIKNIVYKISLGRWLVKILSITFFVVFGVVAIRGVLRIRKII